MDRYVVNGVSFDFIDVDESTQRETVPGNTYEPAVMKLLHEVFSKHKRGTFLDIGALYGYFACYVGKLSPEVKVVAFEPSLRSALVIEKNLELNCIGNGSVERVALASENRQQDFLGKTLIKDQINTGKSYQSKLFQVEQPLQQKVRESGDGRVSIAAWFSHSLSHLLRLASGWNHKEVVNCVVFDERYPALSDGPVVVKIDVHGAEVSVLRGMRRYLSEKVDVLFLEMHRDDMLVEGTHGDTVDMLLESGLTLYEMLDFRSDSKWRLEKLGKDGLERLRSSKHWSIGDKAVMKMVLGIRDGVINV